MLTQVVVKTEVFITMQIDVPDGADINVGIDNILESLIISVDADDSLGEIIERDITNWEVMSETKLELE